MEKYQKIAQEIRLQIPKLLEQGLLTLPTQEEMCRRWHVSRQTVRSALSLLEQEGLITRLQGSGSHLTGLLPGKENNRIALLTGTDTDYIYPSLIRDLDRNLAAQGFRLEVYITSGHVGQERQHLTGMIASPPRALITECCPGALLNPNQDLYDRLRRDGTQIVFLFGTYGNYPAYPFVKDANEQGAFLLTGHLLSFGHKRIAGIFQADTQQGQERALGYLQALLSHSVPIDDTLLFRFSEEELFALRRRQDTSFLDAFIKKGLRECTAVVCYNDEIAYWLISRLQREGISVPGDISVAGFDNSYLRSLGNVSLTTLGHKPQEITDSVCRMLLRLFQGDTPDSISLPWTLIPGSSIRVL